MGRVVPVELAIVVVVLIVRFFWASGRRLLEGRVNVAGPRLRIVRSGEVVWSRAVLQWLGRGGGVQLRRKRTRWQRAELLQPRIDCWVCHVVCWGWQSSSGVGE